MWTLKPMNVPHCHTKLPGLPGTLTFPYAWFCNLTHPGHLETLGQQVTQIFGRLTDTFHHTTLPLLASPPISSVLNSIYWKAVKLAAVVMLSKILIFTSKPEFYHWQQVWSVDFPEVTGSFGPCTESVC